MIVLTTILDRMEGPQSAFLEARRQSLGIPMINAIRLSIGNGRTYENVKIMTLAELGSGDAERLFGAATFCFQHQGKFRFVHSNNVNMIHLNRTRPALEGSVPYEKIVCCDESTYGPGVILSPHHLGRLGIDEFMTTDGRSPPLLVTSAPEGLVRLGTHHILTLECQAILPDLEA